MVRSASLAPLGQSLYQTWLRISPQPDLGAQQDLAGFNGRASQEITCPAATASGIANAMQLRDPCTRQPRPTGSEAPVVISLGAHGVGHTGGTCLRQCAAMISGFPHTGRTTAIYCHGQCLAPNFCSHVPGPRAFWHPGNTQRSRIRASSCRPRIIIGRSALLRTLRSAHRSQWSTNGPVEEILLQPPQHCTSTRSECMA